MLFVSNPLNFHSKLIGLTALNGSKVNLKQKKISEPETVFTQADIWSNEFPTNNTKDILSEVTSSQNIADHGIFAKNIPLSTQTQASSVPTNIPITKPNNISKINIIGMADDDDLGGLRVGKILEKEDDLDYDTFGKKSIAQGVTTTTKTVKTTVTTTTTKVPIAAPTADDFVVESKDILAKLEVTTTSPALNKEKTSIKNTFIMADIPSVDIDITNLDLNAYLEENSKGGGGLFD